MQWASVPEYTRAGPFIFIATNRLKPGKLDAERNRVSGLVDFVEANEPRLLAFNEYVNEQGAEVAARFVPPRCCRWFERCA